MYSCKSSFFQAGKAQLIPCWQFSYFPTGLSSACQAIFCARLKVCNETVTNKFPLQIFHMCDEEGNRIPHLCANETSFNQEYRICDWDYNFNCTESPVSWDTLQIYKVYSKSPFFPPEMVLPERADVRHRSARRRRRGLLSSELTKYLLSLRSCKGMRMTEKDMDRERKRARERERV